MAFSFPSSPTVGDVSIQNGRSFTYAGNNVWELTTAAASGGGSGLTWSSVPASATASGTAGQIAYDGSCIYVATGANAWKRAALTSWSLDQFYSSVLLLLHGDGTVNDSSSYSRTLAAYGNAAATGDPKFGTASLTFDGSGDYLKLDSSSSLAVTGDFTIDCWVRPASSNVTGGIAHRGIYETSDGSWTGLQFSIRALGTYFRFYFWGTSTSTEQYIDVAQSYFPANTWTHLAMVRSGTTGYVFADGEVVGTVTGLGTPPSSSQPVYIGTWPASNSGSIAFAGYWNGQIDELRITTVARYTSAFTKPTAAS